MAEKSNAQRADALRAVDVEQDAGSQAAARSLRAARGSRWCS